MKLHDLKIIPKNFDEKMKGRKLWEIRKNDRDFKKGDLLALREWNVKGYTGRTIYQTVDYIYCNDEYLKDGYVILTGSCVDSSIGDFLRKMSHCQFEINEIKIIQASLMGCNEQMPIELVAKSIKSINEKLNIMKEIVSDETIVH